MSNSKHNGVVGPGPETPIEMPDLATVKKWLKDDIGRAISLLNALHSDADLQNQMAEWMLGRIENYKNKPVDDPAQVKIPGL